MKKLDKKLRYMIITILISTIVLGIYYIAMKFYIDYKEREIYRKLADYVQREENQNEEEEKEEEEPEEQVEDKEEVKSERMLKLEELHAENNDIVAWIEIADTNINYPVLHTDNNSFYLNHNYKKKYSASGSIFLDEAVDMDLPSSNFLMYGHRNKNKIMFEHLLKYKDYDFYKNHKTIKFTTLKEDKEYEILAVFYSRVYYTDEKNVFRYYFFTNAETQEEYDYYVSEAKKASIYDTGVSANYGEQLITLSTCEYSKKNGRFVVVAKKVI